ncbi:MAG: MFS transporter [Nanoarchaeota archaeon]|nr:MFS transporter [Nanoarchaeota archaeon]
MNYKTNAILLVIIDALILANFAASTLIVFLKDNGISISQILLLQGIGSIIIILLEIPTGIFADVYGRKSSIIFGSLMYIFAGVLMIFASSFVSFFLALSVSAFAIVFFSGALTAIIYDSLNQAGVKNLPKFFSYANIFKAVALGVATILGGIIAQFSYRYNFVIMVFLGFVALFISFIIKEPAYKQKKTTIIKESHNLRKTIKYVLNRDPLLLIMGMTAVLGNLMIIILVYMQPLMRDVGFGIAQFGFIFAILAIFQALGGRVGCSLEKRFKAKNFAFIVIYGIAFSYAILAISFTPLLFLLSSIILAFFAGMFVPVWLVYQNKFIPSQKRATINSLGSLINSGVFIFFAPIFGLFTEVVSMRFSILLASIFSLLVVPILARKISNKLSS